MPQTDFSYARPRPTSGCRTPAPHRATANAPLVAALTLVGAALSGAVVPLPAQESPDEDRWKTRIEGGFNGATGNKSFAILRSGFSLEHLDTETAEVGWSVAYRYGKSEGELVADELKTSIKVDWRPDATWSPFAFASGVRDPIRRLDVRANGGAGAKYTFVRSDAGEASLSNALLFEYENFDQGADQGVEALESAWNLRWSLRAKAERSLGESARVQHTSFYQPVWDELDDFLLEMTTSLTTPVLGGVDLVVEHEYLHDATPPPDVVRDDHRFSVLFRLEM